MEIQDIIQILFLFHNIIIMKDHLEVGLLNKFGQQMNGQEVVEEHLVEMLVFFVLIL